MKKTKYNCFLTFPDTIVNKEFGKIYRRNILICDYKNRTVRIPLNDVHLK